MTFVLKYDTLEHTRIFLGVKMDIGNALALIGAALAVAIPAVGSSFGMTAAQQAAAGVISEEPEKFGKTLILQLLPSSNALYGFVVAFLVLLNTVMAGAGAPTYTNVQGLMVLGACIPVALVGMSAIAQGKVCAACITMVGKRGELSGRAITMAIFIELFALFGLIFSILAVMRIPIGV